MKAIFLTLAFLSTALTITPLRADPIPKDCLVGDFYVGCQAYTFHKFNVMEAIERTANAGGKLIEFFPGQKVGGDAGEAIWDHHASEESIQLVQARLAKFHIRATGYGVVTPNSAEDWRKTFEFAKKLGLYSITTESVRDIDVIEKLVKEFDIRVGFHEHQRQLKDPNYRVWDPNFIMSVVKGRDKRIGAAADTGHWATSGLEPLKCLKILRSRVISVHLKDRPEIGKHMGDVPYGTGVSQVGKMLAELKHQHFNGEIAIEYENNWDHSVPDVAQCIGFVRGYSANN